MTKKRYQLTPLPTLSKEELESDRLSKLSVQKKMQAVRVVPSSQGLVSDFMSLVHLEMSKLAGVIATREDCLSEINSKHLSRLVNALDRLVRIEGDIRGMSEVDRLGDKELKAKIKTALTALKMSDQDIDKVIKKSKDDI
jgi:hypothetical protein